MLPSGRRGLDRKGKSLAQKGTSGGGGALGGLGGGVAGAGFMGDNDGKQGQRGVPGQGQAQQGFHSEGGGQVQDQIAPEPDSTSAVDGQSSQGQTSMGEFMDDDESIPEPTASAGGGQKYSDIDVADIDVDGLSAEEFGEVYNNLGPKARGKLVQNALQGQSNGKRFLSEAMGPAGGAIATVTMGAMGLSGGAAAAAGVLPAAAIAYAGKQSIQSGSVRQGITNTLKAPGQLSKQAKQEVTNRFGLSKQSAAESSGGSGDSGGNNDNRFDQ